MAQNTTRLLNLDILRLVSAVLVLAYHYGFRMEVTGEGGGIGFPEFAPAAPGLARFRFADLFFAISGYVITLSAEGRTAFDFAVGRVARLWPTCSAPPRRSCSIAGRFPASNANSQTVSRPILSSTPGL